MTESHGAVQEAEPESPPWLPALGLALFVVAGVAWSLCSSDSSGQAAGAAAASGSAPAAAASAPAAH